MEYHGIRINIYIYIYKVIWGNNIQWAIANKIIMNPLLYLSLQNVATMYSKKTIK